MTTTALQGLTQQLTDVDNLIDRHQGRGRPGTNEQPLLRSCVVLTYAAWEVYIEESLVWVAERLVAPPHGIEKLPQATKNLIALSVSKNPWILSEDGWRTQTLSIITNKVRGDALNPTDWGLNTADVRRINALHIEVLGQTLLSQCNWQNFTNQNVLDKINALVRLRSEIAHRGQADNLSLPQIQQYRDFAQRLSEKLDSVIEAWVTSQLAKA
ncbi:HEPN domain-containing protein [Rathayibacter sp. AY1D2]|uniref:HEPN domain-containing protein n=1 Tax=Rathayibacter sp. AY1D2 TaxID=2080543 RepID=UPI0011AFE36C|nr:MAE_28990/MAE_18760 family HEPN-like nuclease [Rathayibacter sp. AY1D2]